MPTEAKRATVAELTTLIQASPSSIVADYRGLKVSEIGAVRRSLREKGIHYRVVKNRLAQDRRRRRPAVTELRALLEGPSAIAGRHATRRHWPRASSTPSARTGRRQSGAASSGHVHRGRARDPPGHAAQPRGPPRPAGRRHRPPLSTMAGLLVAPLRNLGGGLVAARRAEGGRRLSAATAASDHDPARGLTRNHPATKETRHHGYTDPGPDPRGDRRHDRPRAVRVHQEVRGALRRHGRRAGRRRGGRPGRRRRRRQPRPPRSRPSSRPSWPRSAPTRSRSSRSCAS